jgi:hypothetical protein
MLLSPILLYGVMSQFFILISTCVWLFKAKIPMCKMKQQLFLSGFWTLVMAQSLPLHGKGKPTQPG